ncbi:hypothetical protein QL285_023291 [Trifolium repens]|nr:hypothetical protein QL285_023291 [Trifolium repens]
MSTSSSYTFMPLTTSSSYGGYTFMSTKASSSYAFMSATSSYNGHIFKSIENKLISGGSSFKSILRGIVYIQSKYMIFNYL